MVLRLLAARSTGPDPSTDRQTDTLTHTHGGHPACLASPCAIHPSPSLTERGDGRRRSHHKTRRLESTVFAKARGIRASCARTRSAGRKRESDARGADVELQSSWSSVCRHIGCMISRCASFVVRTLLLRRQGGLGPVSGQNSPASQVRPM